MSLQGVLTSHPFARGEFDPLDVLYYDFVDFTDDGGPDRSLHPGYDFGPFQFCFNTTPSVSVGDVVAQPPNAFLCPAHGLTTGDQVRFDTDGILPIGLYLATYYAVTVVDADHFTVISVFADPGLGHMNATKRGVPFDLTGATPFAWVKQNPDDPDANKLLDLGPTILAPNNNGTIQIYVLGSLTEAYASAKDAFWNLLVVLAGGSRVNLARGRFDINKLPTHQFA